MGSLKVLYILDTAASVYMSRNWKYVSRQFYALRDCAMLMWEHGLCFNSFIYIAHCSFRLYVPKLVICIQTILCPERLCYVNVGTLLVFQQYYRNYVKGKRPPPFLH